jgi:hypothetical protein
MKNGRMNYWLETDTEKNLRCWMPMPEISREKNMDIVEPQLQARAACEAARTAALRAGLEKLTPWIVEQTKKDRDPDVLLARLECHIIEIRALVNRAGWVAVDRELK